MFTAEMSTQGTGRKFNNTSTSTSVISRVHKFGCDADDLWIHMCRNENVGAKFLQVRVKTGMNLDVTCDRSLEDLDGWRSQDVIREGVPPGYSSGKEWVLVDLDSGWN